MQYSIFLNQKYSKTNIVKYYYNLKEMFYCNIF